MSNNPQWKMFQPPESHSSPLHDILDLQHSTMQAKQAYRNGAYSGEYPSSPRDVYGGGGGGGVKAGGAGRFQPAYDACPPADTAAPAYDSNNHPPVRETGIVEKLLHSYGFIQCCERQARLFFHFSQFGGNTEHLKIGDPVEFEMTYDRRTGKPIASSVTKIAPEVVLSEARVTGTVTTEVKGEGSGDNAGRISYENRGECFFLPYTRDDVEGNVVLRTGDAVSFQIATNQRGTLGACHVRFENPQHPVKYHGVVCSMKDKFGFIERADVVKEIFFHFSETESEEDLALGDDVEFLIQTRNGKEVACEIRKLPAGSVVFEDVSPETLRGQVLKPLERGARTSDPLPGRLRYRAPDRSEAEVPFGDKDRCGEFTLRHGDWVRFQLATDRRDRLRRATNIALLDDSFSVSGERRERGVVRDLRDGFGFLRCLERDRPLLFRFEEVLRLGRELSVGDEVEFTVDPPAALATCDARQCAIRIKHLPPGSVVFETLVERAVRGTVLEALERPDSPDSLDNAGLIACHLERVKRTLPFRLERGERPPRPGDKVFFDLYRVTRTKELVAAAVRVPAEPPQEIPRAAAHGYVAALKDGFGFIETADHSREVFFHFSNLEGVPESLELGAEVEYAVGRGGGGGCASAEWVRPLPRGSLPTPRAASPPLHGTVTRTLRALNPDQAQYCGVVRAESGALHEFGITGLACKREILQVGDPVTFQVDAEGRAANIVPVRKKRRATVDAIKGGFGFLSVSGAGEEGGGGGGAGPGEARRLFFHMSEVRGTPTDLQPGDTVEFVMLTNPRNGKSSACNVVKIPRASGASKARPERLLARLRTASLEESGAPRVVALRAPRGPDGTRGFRPRRARAD